MYRREGLDKLTGRERYVDDLPLPGALWAATVRSPVARGRIRRVHLDGIADRTDLVVLDHRDVPGRNHAHLMTEDQPVLAGDLVRHLHEPILLLAHPDRDTVRRAAAAVRVEIEPLPAVDDFLAVPTPGQLQHGADNVFKRIRIDKGDVAAALASAPVVVEGEYRTGSQEHVYLEPQGMVAWVDGDTVVVQGSMQCPYYIHEGLKVALGRDDDGVRVVYASTGGGFGGKEEFPSGVAIHAAMLALAAGQPVKLIYERGEDMQATTKRHPSWVRHRTGLTEDGRLLAQEVEVALDAGAYTTLSPVVLSRGVIHAAGPYRCDNVRIDGRAVLTNRVPFGAFRGFGAPQTLFAVERHMDVIAGRLGIDPVELRRRNLIREGDATATGQVIRDGADRDAVLDRALTLSEFSARRLRHQQLASHPYLRRGMGLALFLHGGGFTGGGEVYLDSRVEVAGRSDGRVEVLCASTEMGQGTNTVLTSLVANRLGRRPEEVVVAPPDTGRVPASGPTVASRTVMVVGRLVERACDDLRRRLTDGTGEDDAEALTGDALRERIVHWHRQNPGQALLGKARYQAPPGIQWDDETYRGDAYGAFSWAAYVAEVEVDLRTYTARVVDFVAVQEVGRVLHEVLARGQIQGGVVQGIGWALLEECKWQEGGMANAQLTNYIIPTSEDVPPIRVAFLEAPYEHGAQGAKGIGELPMDGPGPAIANAVAVALGVDPREIPLTPEAILELVEAEDAA